MFATTDEIPGDAGVARVAGEPPVRAALDRLAGELGTLLAESEIQMQQLGQDFQALAGATNGIVETAGEIVRCAESEQIAAVLPNVQALGSAATVFIHQRLEGTSGVLDTVSGEERLLEQLARLTRGQKAIVKETEMLRVLTNIEVARLGEVGAGFQYLAHELDEFSQSVARSTAELMEHTDERRRAIGETRRSLTAALPGMREEFARIENGLSKAIGEVDRALAELRQAPARFQRCVEEVASQITGVVAAVQAHDITRQQIEHVADALRMIAGMEAGEGADGGAQLRAGLSIQSYQLRNVAQTVEGWLTQIRSCLEGIGRIASSELLNMGRLVMAQESAVSAQLVRIEQLDAECEAGDAQVQASFAGIAGLMQLVNEHLARSKSVRDRLQLLMFNSIVEASHLGSQADGILEISTTIKRISASWGEITTQSEAATAQIRRLVDESHSTVEAFSEASYGALREARGETETGLKMLREAAQCAETRGRAVESAVVGLQGRLAEIGERANCLETDFGRLKQVLEEIESLWGQMEENRATAGPADTEAIERRFAADYTTEIERAVLRAALTGGPLPAAQQSFAGNSVELF